MDKPRILYFDIETSITIFAGFQLGKQHIDHTQVLKRPEVMCISWAWNDEKVRHATFDLDKYDLTKKDDDADYALLKQFSEEYAKADLIVGQNSEWFDVPWLRSRIIRHKLPPLPEVLHDDMYKQTQKSVRHLSHKLDDVGDYLGYGRKAEHGHGLDWWIRIAYFKDRRVLRDMVKYCDVDVEKLRKVYKHQLPYVKSKLNMSTFTGRACCTQCGSTDVIKDGFARPGLAKYQRFRCNSCGHPFRGGENLNKNTKRFSRDAG